MGLGESRTGVPSPRRTRELGLSTHTSVLTTTQHWGPGSLSLPLA